MITSGVVIIPLHVINTSLHSDVAALSGVQYLALVGAREPFDDVGAHVEEY
jgi:hypothetical protein